jgi:phage tail-like protein
MKSRRDLRVEPVAVLFMVVCVTWLLDSMPVAAATAIREDPVLSGVIVKLEVQGGPTAFFTEISGLGSESEVVEQKTAGRTGQAIVQSLPGRLKWKEIVLKRSVTSDRSFWTWRAQVETGNLKAATLNFVITLLSPSMQPVARWEGSGGWPSKLIVIPAIDRSAPASTPVSLLEELTIAHSGLVRTQ